MGYNHTHMVLATHKALYIFKGIVNFPVKLTIIKQVLVSDGLLEESPAFRKKIRYILDECITNIINYYDQNPLSDKNCSVKTLGSRHKIRSLEFENYILDKHVEPLKERINAINKAGKDEKNQLFIHALKKDLHENAIGAGLGLLTLKQKCHVELKASFKRTEKGIFKFKLAVIILEP